MTLNSFMEQKILKLHYFFEINDKKGKNKFYPFLINLQRKLKVRVNIRVAVQKLFTIKYSNYYEQLEVFQGNSI